MDSGSKSKRNRRATAHRDSKTANADSSVSGRNTPQGVETTAHFREALQRALRESEEKYRNLFQHSNDAIFIHDLDGKIVDFNHRTLELFGYTEDEIHGLTVPQLHPAGELEKSDAAFSKISVDGFVNFEINFRKKNGEEFPAEVSSSLFEVGGRKLVQGIVRDITEQKRFENALRESEEMYRALVEQSLQGVIVIQDFKILFANTAMAEITGYTLDELRSLTREDIVARIHADDQELVWGRLRDRLAGKPVNPHYELRIIRKNGEDRWLDIYSNLIEYNGSPAIQATFIDIHERKQIEQTLYESEEKFRTLAEKSPNMIFINRGGRVVYANDRCEEITGFSRDEFYSDDFDFRSLIAPEYRETIERNLALHMQGEDIESYEYTLITKDGKHVDAIINTKLINYEGERAILGIVTDITRIKMLEKQLQQSQKMEAIGTLAGGVAHDFNNLLIGIMGYSDLLLAQVEDNESLRSEITEIKRAAERAASLTRQLLAFGRRQMLQMEIIDLNKVVLDMEEMLRRLIGEHIELESILEPILHPVKADPGQLELVIINLVINARDAMPDGGRLTIRTENVRVDRNSSRLSSEAKSGEFVRLAVEDTGIGIDKETLARIFDPFFSTKGPGIGTGLGLSTVYGNVKQHNGWTEVTSQPGNGSIFQVYLPACIEEPECLDTDEIRTGKLCGNGETILLVEDEERVRRFIARVLGENGYEVHEATTAEEGLAIFERMDGRIDLLFSDVVLPGQSGVHLAEELCAKKPGVKVVLNSGYTGQQSHWKMIQDRGYRFVQKPFSIVDLLTSVGKALRNG